MDTEVFMEEVRTRRPEMPTEKRDRFVRDFGVTPYDASVLASEQALAEYFEAAAKGAQKPKNVANWIINDLLSALSAARRKRSQIVLSRRRRSMNSSTYRAGTISSKQGKEVFAEMFATGKPAAAIVEEKGLKQESDTGCPREHLREGPRREPRSRRKNINARKTPGDLKCHQRPGDETVPERRIHN